ncbi:MAG: hypothetical protein Q7U14_11000, partial [Lacisediminimonas sp.]|nr:hypothetical protein [Lacisediminimonas sp.]
RARHASPGGWSIGEFFRSLFGTDADHEHVHIYTEALRRGSFLVTVETDDEQQLRQARDLIAQFHPIDIEERAAHWRSQGWTRADPQQAPYTDEQVRGERAQYPGPAAGSQAGSSALTNAVRSYQRPGAASAASGMVGDRSAMRMSQSDTTEAGGDSLLGGGDSLIGK